MGGLNRIIVPDGGSTYLSSGYNIRSVRDQLFISGENGTSYGCGGGPSYAGSGQPVQPSGAGANGVVIITEYF